MKFKDLKVGDKFTFPETPSFPHDCVKTGPRSYETAYAVPHYQQAGLPPEIRPMKCRVGTISVEVKKQ